MIQISGSDSLERAVSGLNERFAMENKNGDQL